MKMRKEQKKIRTKRRVPKIRTQNWSQVSPLIPGQKSWIKTKTSANCHCNSRRRSRNTVQPTSQQIKRVDARLHRLHCNQVTVRTEHLRTGRDVTEHHKNCRRLSSGKHRATSSYLCWSCSSTIVACSSLRNSLPNSSQDSAYLQLFQRAISCRTRSQFQLLAYAISRVANDTQRDLCVARQAGSAEKDCCSSLGYCSSFRS